MTQLLIEIRDILLNVENMNKDFLIAILNHLETEEQARILLDWLKENPNQKRVEILEKTFQIVDNN